MISFIGQYRAQARGGLGRYETELFRRLEGRLDITYAAAGSPRVPPGLQRLGSLAGRDLQAVAGHCILIPRGDGAQLIHLANQNMASALMFERPRVAVVTVQDVIPFRRRVKVRDVASLVERVMRALCVAGLRRAQKLIAISGFTKSELVNRFRLPAEKIVVTPLGVDTSCFRPGAAPASFTSRYGIQPDQPAILYVGSQAPRKNLATLYRAFAKLRCHVAGVQLWIVGAERTPWAVRPEDLDAIHYAGHVAEEALPHFYNAASALAMPSLDEGFGLPVVEAMAAGCPVVAARATSLPEVVGDAGILIDPLDVDAWVDALLRVLSDGALAAELRASGLQRARCFSWDKTAELTMMAYRETLGAPE